jgi:glycosyltransferase involved in cell wall biosynthesis
VERYLLELVGAIAAFDPGNAYVIFVNHEDRNRLGSLPANFAVVRAARRNRLVRLGWQQVGLPVYRRARRLDVLHSPSFILPLADRRARHMLTIHDLTSFSHPALHEPLRRSWPYQRAIAASIRLAQRISVPSHAVRDELVRLVPGVDSNRIRVIPHGVASDFRQDAATEAPAVRRRLGLPSSYILFVGTVQPRKNLERALEVYRQLVVADQIDEHLVLAGRFGWDYQRVIEASRTPELRDRVHLLGYVDQGALPGLYAGARLLLYPSVQEGFGLPVLEALACGVPVVGSSVPALIENFGGVAELARPEDVGGLSRAVLRLLRDDELRERRRHAGLILAAQFRWDATARATVACYEELAGADGAIG